MLSNRYIIKSAFAVRLKNLIPSNFFWKGRTLYGLMVITAAIIYYRQSMKLHLPWYINDYLNDLLCLPLVLGVLSSMMRYMKNDISFQLSKSFIVCLALYYSIYFEYYLPEGNSRYTGDWMDVLLYFLGGFLFYRYQRTLSE